MSFIIYRLCQTTENNKFYYCNIIIAIKTMNTDQFCRLCLKEDTLYHDLLESNFAQMLDSLTKIKVDKNDKFSTSVCTPCLELLKTAYEIQQKIIKANKTLEDRMQSSDESETRPECVFIKEEIVDAGDDPGSSHTSATEDSNLPESNENGDVEKEKQFICVYCGEDLKNPRDLAWHRYKRHSLRKIRRYYAPLPRKESEKPPEIDLEKQREANAQAIKTMAEETRRFYEMLDKEVNQMTSDEEQMTQKKFCPIILKRKRKSE